MQPWERPPSSNVSPSRRYRKGERVERSVGAGVNARFPHLPIMTVSECPEPPGPCSVTLADNGWDMVATAFVTLPRRSLGSAQHRHFE
jgi:hypothetical protein